MRMLVCRIAWALALFALCGCSMLDYLPRSSPGRPASSVRRVRTGTPAPPRREASPATPAEQEPAVREGDLAFSAISAREAEELAAMLDPHSQALGGFGDLSGPLAASLEALSRKPQAQAAFSQPGGVLTFGQLFDTALELKNLLPELDANPQLLAERFVWYELAPSPLLTGYYTPEVEASLTREPGFEVPLYGKPPDLRQAGPEEQRQGRPKAYRASGGAIQPYFERKEIDQEGALAGQDLEVAWVKTPLDAFRLQTEGAGTLRLRDGSARTAQYAASNGYEFQGIGKLLLENGALPRERLSREGIRQWCEANPERAREVMAQNKSYVFFELRPGAAVGALGKPLTALVSLATDPSLLPLGAVAAMDAPLQNPDGGLAKRLRGLVLAQDTGSDIRGHRLDLYLGSGERAERLESGMRSGALLHLLVSKNALRSKETARGQ